MPAVPVRFTRHGLLQWTSLLAAQKLCVGEDAREGGSCPAWHGAQGTKGLSEKDPLAIGHPKGPLNCSHSGKIRGPWYLSVSGEGLEVLLTQNLSLRDRAGYLALGQVLGSEEYEVGSGGWVELGSLISMLSGSGGRH